MATPEHPSVGSCVTAEAQAIQKTVDSKSEADRKKNTAALEELQTGACKPFLEEYRKSRTVTSSTANQSPPTAEKFDPKKAADNMGKLQPTEQEQAWYQKLLKKWAEMTKKK